MHAGIFTFSPCLARFLRRLGCRCCCYRRYRRRCLSLCLTHDDEFENVVSTTPPVGFSMILSVVGKWNAICFTNKFRFRSLVWWMTMTASYRFAPNDVTSHFLRRFAHSRHTVVSLNKTRHQLPNNVPEMAYCSTIYRYYCELGLCLFVWNRCRCGGKISFFLSFCQSDVGGNYTNREKKKGTHESEWNGKEWNLWCANRMKIAKW